MQSKPSLDHLETEGRNPDSARLDELSPLELVRLMNAEDARVIPAVAAQAEALARAIEVIKDRLQGGGRLVYVGAGTSGRLGVLDATECPPTFSAPPGQVVGIIAGGTEALTRAVEGAEDRPELAEQDLRALKLGPGDVLVAIATSGRTPYVLGAAEYARRQGAFTIGLSCNSTADLTGVVDLPIVPVVGPEVLSGSTRLKAGTATKLVLNTLSTGAMVQLGKTFGNLMVDLRATNSKLQARTNRIVRELTGVSAEEADELLAVCGGELKTALVARLAAVGPEEARERLRQAAGRVGGALGPSFRRLLSSFRDAARPLHDLVLGIDGGGTRTVVLLARGSTVLGRGEAGPSNLRAVGEEDAFAALHQAIQAAFAAAALPAGPVASACLGLAGAGRAEERQQVLDWARQVGLAERVEVTTDAALLLAAGTPGGWGLALVAGTGSIAWGRDASGREARAGGWGPLLGDEGSGYAIALAALQAVARADDGRGPATALTERLLAAMGLPSAAALVPALHGGAWDRPALAALAPVVLETASCDAIATAVVGAAARQLAQTTAALAQALGWGSAAFPLALAGGLLAGSAVYRAGVLEAIREMGLLPDPVTVVPEPAEGAVRLALELGGAAENRRGPEQGEGHYRV
jgi:N-acetylmuramic acid 6-phosphate etherase